MNASVAPRSLHDGRRLLAERTVAELYAPVADEMAAVERMIDAALRSASGAVDDVLRYGSLLGGKRLRPALVLLSAKACGSVTAAHVTIGAVMELIHTATLVHDDLLDDAEVRRHRETVHRRWGDSASVLLGDWLFAEAYRLAATTGSAAACREIGEAARRVCEGELRQALGRGNLRLSEGEYYEIIQAKTAELCRVSARLGASLAGAPEACVEALDRYGNALGVAFQIADDYLDVWGDAARVGKTLGTDLAQGKATLPLVRLLGQLPPEARDAALRALDGPPERRAAELAGLWQRTDARAYTRAQASAFADRAVAALDRLPSTGAKTVLARIARFSVERRS